MYAGRVYDGPLEGQYRTSGRPFLEFQNLNAAPESLLRIRPGGVVNVNVTKGEYRWSHALRAWVFVWPH